jgi:anion-transporting  ArsA/GET3 family ATPase
VRATLGDVLDRRLTIVTGKGGVGRSAVASAIARTRARSGQRVLAMAIDRGTGLSAHLGHPLAHEPTEVLPGLYGAVVDPASALDEYVRQRVGSAPVAVASRIFRVLAYTVPGVRDIVLIGKAVHEATRGPWDAVILDASPAGQVQSTLGAPHTISELVGRGTVHDQAVEMMLTLGDASVTQLVVVATAEELALVEADAVNSSADSVGISTCRRLIINRVLTEPGFDTPPAGGTARHDAAVLHLEVVRSQQLALAGRRTDLQLPLVFGTHRPVDLSEHLSSLLEVVT